MRALQREARVTQHLYERALKQERSSTRYDTVVGTCDGLTEETLMHAFPVAAPLAALHQHPGPGRRWMIWKIPWMN